MPRSLYPASKSNSRFQRITIAACATCNNGTADDDAHFRNVVLVAGEAIDAVKELWSGPVRRGFAQVDGHRRARDIFDLMRPAPDVGPNRYRIFPAEDPRILQTVRKIIRGLSRHHGLAYPLSDGQVFADVMRQTIPEEILAAMEHNAAEPDVLEYGYLSLDEPHGLSSAWFLRFFQRTTFIGFVFASEAARQQHMGH
ncbi:MAG: hypothetical protein E5X48_14075 [Mesorhizobium sp.]|nr:MAG: hypothetical protein E5X48_14075 [Mesorhizobium sp.]